MRGEGATARAIEPSEGLRARGLAIAERTLRGRGDAETTCMIALEAPVVPCERLLAAAGSEPRVLFAPSGAPHMAGFGVAHEVRLEGAARFARLRTDAAAIFERLSLVRAEGGYALAPRLVGGASFATGGTPDPTFGDGWFVLPRVSYVVDRGAAWLVLSVPPGVPSEQVLAEVDASFDALLTPPADETPTWSAREQGDRASFTAMVAAVVDAIRRGELAKVVAARRATIELSRPIDETTLLAGLGDRFPLCTRFALGCGATVFLGATPERLVAREGARMHTEALAGSVAAGGTDRLLASAKDREEHRLVVDAIAAALVPLTEALDVASEPSVRELQNIVHMRTPIEGTLRAGVDVLALVDALHPTPAVCGVPTDDARRFIVAHERAPRGLYAGPFGYVDANGDGSFVVALRSALFDRDRAFVYAGAGVVRDSSPDLELAETDLKMQAILGALGGDPR